MKLYKDRPILNYFKMKWDRHGDRIILIFVLIALALMIIKFESCTIESGKMPCMTVVPISWNIKCNPEIEVPIIDAMNHYEVKALLYDDSGESELMECVSVKKDTVILDICDIDLVYYQNDKQLCEIYLIDFN